MFLPPLSEETLRETKAAYELHGTITGAAAALGITRSTVRHRLRAMGVEKTAKETAPIVATAEPLPDPDLPISDILAHRRAAFERKHAHHKAKRWRRYHIPSKGPYALMFFGDPHLDDDGCNLPLWDAHVDLAANTDNLFAINIGDTTNNWAGRLARLWAEQNASAETARKLVKHYLAERGIPWLLWLSGNHDMWDGPVGRAVFENHAPEFVTLEDWQAKVTLVSPCGTEIRLWAAHNFKGNSIWNNLHGLERAAQMQDWAHLYVAGHHHDSGLRQGENTHRHFVYNLMRVRGYKYMDHYADVHGFGEHEYGAAGVAIIDPSADSLNKVTCFLDPFEAVEFLKFKRARYEGKL